MKKLLSLALAAVLAFSTVACGKEEAPAAPEKTETAAPEVDVEATRMCT